MLQSIKVNSNKYFLLWILLYMLGKIKWQKSNRHVAKAKLSPHSFKAFIISLFLLVASIQFAEPYTCPSSIPTSMNIIKETGTLEWWDLKFIKINSNSYYSLLYIRKLWISYSIWIGWRSNFQKHLLYIPPTAI